MARSYYAVMRLKGGYTYMLKVVGVQEKEGIYQGLPYHNYVLHCTREDVNAFGVVTEQVKVKSKSIKDVFGCTMTNSDWDLLVGKDIRVFYDKYGQADEIRVDESA